MGFPVVGFDILLNTGVRSVFVLGALVKVEGLILLIVFSCIFAQRKRVGIRQIYYVVNDTLVSKTVITTKAFYCALI